MSLRERLLGEPPWSSPERALAFVDPRLAELFSRETISDLLAVAAGQAVTSERRISEKQFRLLMEHRVLILIPDSWEIPDQFEGAQRELLIWSMDLEVGSLAAIKHLKDAGIEPLVLKGMATSRLDYLRPELRHCGDLDLLVEEHERSHAVSVLKSNGYTLNAPRNFDPEFEKGYDLVSPDGIQVDIHSRICHTSNNCPPDMLANGESIPDLDSCALPAEARLVHAAAHFFFGPPQHRRLSGFADITAILAKQPPPDIEATRDAARALGLEQAAYAALAAEAMLTGKDVSEYSSWEQPAGLLNLAYSRTKRLRAAEQFYIASAFEGSRNRLRYISQKALPGKEFLEHRGGLAEYARGRTRK